MSPEVGPAVHLLAGAAGVKAGADGKGPGVVVQAEEREVGCGHFVWRRSGQMDQGQEHQCVVHGYWQQQNLPNLKIEGFKHQSLSGKSICTFGLPECPQTPVPNGGTNSIKMSSLVSMSKSDCPCNIRSVRLEQS